MVRGRVDRFRHPYRKAIERYKRRGLRTLHEEQVHRGWVVVTGFWPRIENPRVLWHRSHARRRARRLSEQQSRAYYERIKRLAYYLLHIDVYAKRAARRAATLPRLLARPRELLGMLRRAVYDFAKRFAERFMEKFSEEMREWLRDSWLYKNVTWLMRKIEFIQRLWALMEEVMRGEAIPLFEARVETVDGVKVWRVQRINQLLETLDPETRQRIIENIVAIIQRGRPLYRDWLNPYMRILLSVLIPQLYRDPCHHKGFMVKAAPVILEEVEKRGVKRVYVFLRVMRVEEARADALIGKAVRITDPVLEELASLKPEEDEFSILNASRRATPHTSPHRRIVEYPEMLLAVHEAGVRRALALAAGVPEQDGVEGLDPCSLYLAPIHWHTYDDIPEPNKLLMSKPGRRLLGIPAAGMRRISVRDEILDELGIVRLIQSMGIA